MDAIESLSNCIGKVTIRLSVKVLVINHIYFTQMCTKCKVRKYVR